MVQPVNVDFEKVGSFSLTEHIQPILYEAVLLDVGQMLALVALQLGPLRLCGRSLAPGAELCTDGAPDRAKCERQG